MNTNLRISKRLFFGACLLMLAQSASATFYIKGELKCSHSMLAGPIAVNDDNYGPEDFAQTGDVSLNDSDPDGDALTYSVLIPPVNGSLSLNSNGVYNYIPNAQYVGYDYATYQVCDPGGACATATIEFAMTFVNDPPEANDDVFFVQMSTPFTGTVIANDIEYDTELNYWTILSAPSHAASFSLNINGTFNYTPVAGYTGPDTFIYMACDPCGSCDNATVSLNVMTNSAPIANNDSHFTSMNTELDLTVAQNDSDPDGNPLTFSVVTGPAYGSFVMQTDGSYSYIPTDFYSGFDYITYQACDIFNACDQATLSIEIVFVNFNPVAQDDEFSTPEDVPLVNSVATNDYDPNVENIIYNLVTGPVNGTLSWTTATGAFTYTPNANWSGTENIVYLACDNCGACDPATLFIQVNPVNDIPTAVNDTKATTEDTGVSGSVALNDSDVEPGPLTYAVTIQPTYGTISMSSNGNYIYTPASNYFGSDILTYNVCDAQNSCASGTLTITINSVNDAPVLNDETATVNEDQVLNSTVAGNDSDPDGDVLTYEIVNNADYGIFILNANGSYTYTPNANFQGSDMVTYHALDAGGLADAATLTIIVASINDIPVAENDAVTTSEDVSLNSTVAGNDYDADNNVLIYSVITGALNGSFVMNTNGSYTYTPNLNYFGSESITYQASDGQGGIDTAILTITITFVNDIPVVNNESTSTAEDVVLNGNVSTNDIEYDSEAISYQVVSGPASGNFSLGVSGTYSYTPPTNFFGTVTIIYMGCDSWGECDNGILTISITPVNDAPDAVNDPFGIAEDNVLTGSVALNDTDVDNETQTYSIILNVSQGSLSFGSDGSFSYTPPLNYSGVVTFTYQMCDPAMSCDLAVATITVSPVNDLPIANNDNATTPEDVTLNGNVSSNDSDAENQTLTYNVTSGPSSGSLVMASNGTYTFTPVANYFGVLTATYQVCDTQGGCSSATLTITVTSVNDAPVANDDSFTTNEDTMLSASVTANDTDADLGAGSYTIVTNVSQGVLILNSNGSFTYTPALNYNGVITFTYQRCDAGPLCDPAVVTITVTSVNDAPVAQNDSNTTMEDLAVSGSVATNDSDIENQTLTFTVISNPSSGSFLLSANGNYTYTPAPNYFGIVTASYQVCDTQNACANAILTITVSPINDVPFAQSETVGILYNTTYNGTVANNDSDADGESLVYTVTTPPSTGTFNMTSNGGYTYTPDIDWYGQVTIAYMACDGQNTCGNAVLTINVALMNTMPNAENDEASCLEDEAVNGTVADNDSDPDGNALDFTLVSGPSSGIFTLFNDGTYNYNPAVNFYGTVTISYEACDPFNACAMATVTIQVLPVNDAPIAQDELAHLLEDESQDGTVADNDSDIEGDVLTYSVVSAPMFGGIVLNTNGTYTYTPSANYFGMDEVVYQACDPGGACSEATLTLDIQFVNDFPIANDDVYNTLMNQFVSGTVADNDIEIDPEPLTFGTLSNGVNGVFIMNIDGTFTFQPNDGFIGSEVVNYMACDPCGACSPATLIIYVGEINSNPITTDVQQNICSTTEWTFDLDDVVYDQESTNANLDFSVVNGNGGVWTLDANTHIVSYGASQGFGGTATFTYQVCDDASTPLCSNGLVTLELVSSVGPAIQSVSITNNSCADSFSGMIELNTSDDGLNYVWDNGQEGNFIVYLPGGDYTVTITDPNAICGIPTIATYTVTEPDPIVITGLTENPIDETSGGSSDYLVTGGTGAYTYLWLDSNGDQISSDSVLTGLDISSQAGTYTLIVMDANFCTATVSLLVTGLTEAFFYDVQLMPNPVHDIATVNLGPMNANGIWNLYDALGKLVMTDRIFANGNNRMQINMEQLAAGIYEFQIISAGKIGRVSLIKE